ncbi:MAG: hypothetical protein PHX14_04800 [Syntrophomonadaceae bacterium]|nr:hypothetical protein [Syntrophomonadaceae bacterium]
MKNLQINYAFWCEQHPQSPAEEHIAFFHQELLQLYPGLLLRWAKIFGSRWAYFYGNSREVALNTVKTTLKPEYGICIDNPDMLGTIELERLVIKLKECFINVPVF